MDTKGLRSDGLVRKCLYRTHESVALQDFFVLGSIVDQATILSEAVPAHRLS